MTGSCPCDAELQMLYNEIEVLVNGQWDTWYQNIANFDMEVGLGLTDIANAWTACCTGRDATALSIANLPYIPVQVGTDANGNPITVTPAVAGFLAAQNYNNQISDWVDAYDAWQTTQQLLAVAELALYFTQLGNFIDTYKDFMACANTEQANLKSVRATLGGVSASALTAYDTHVSAASSFTWQEVVNAIQSVCDINTDFENYQSQACFGYEKIQKDHIQNMGTHLAQLCTNARDVSNDLKVCLQYLDNGWANGGSMDLYEKCLFTGQNNLSDFLCNAHTLGDTISTDLAACGKLITDCYTMDNGSDFFTIIKPALEDLINNMVMAQGALDDLRTLSGDMLQCITDSKAYFTDVYADQEAAGGPANKVFDIANDLFCSNTGATLLKDCLTSMSDCIVDNKDILDRYVGTLAANGNSSGEYCLGRAIIDQACGLVNDLQTAVTFLSTHGDNCIADYEANYNVKEGLLASTLMNLACDMAICVTAAHTWFENNAVALELCWQQGYSGEKTFAAQVLAEAELLNKEHSTTLQCLLDCADEAKVLYTTAYLQDEILTIGAIHDNAQQLAPCVPATHTWLVQHADQLELCWTQGYAGEKTYAAQGLAEAETLNMQHSEIYDCLKSCLDEAKDCYSNFYLAEEKATALEIHDNAQQLADFLPDSNVWFDLQSDDLELCWDQGYLQEKGFAAQGFVEAITLNAYHSDIYDCLKSCIDEAKDCYTNFYLPAEKLTITEIHDNAQELADCLPLAHEWLCEQADKNRDRYCDFWAPKEDVYVCAVLDKAIDLACETKDCLTDWCDDLNDKWDWWMSCFQDPEKQTIPKLITAAIDACDKNLEAYTTACDRSDELYEKYMTEWCPCDIEDLQKHCDLWNKVNMLEEICDANECLRTTAETLKDCYDDMLNCEKDYLQFVCDMSYDPKYCDMQNRAVTHVAAQYDNQIAELEACIPPWCRAAYLDRVIDLQSDKVRAESLAIQISDRWEWLRNVHEEDRKHNYLQDVIRNFGERWITNSHEMYRSVQQGNDMLLNHIHNRITRGRLYLESSFGHLDRTLSAVNNTVGNGIASVRESHFWPSWYNQGLQSYSNNSINYLNTADDILRIGHDIYAQASSDKVNAAQIARGSVQDGLAAIDRGHGLKNRVLDAASRAENVIQDSDNTALNLISHGHNLHQLAQSSQRDAADIAEQAVQAGLATIDRGHAVKNRALDAATRAENVIANADQVATNLIQQGHALHQMAREAESRAAQIALDATQQGLQAVDRGHQVKRNAIDAAAQADRIIAQLDSTANGMIQNGHNLHRLAIDSEAQAGRIALEATQQGLATIDRGHAVKRMAIDAVTNEGQLANAGIQSGISSIQQGHFWAELAQRSTEAKIDGFNDSWARMTQHLSHGQRYLDVAARFANEANNALATEVNAGKIGLDNALSWYNTGVKKAEIALQSQEGHVNDAIQLYSQTLNRMNTTLNAKTQTQAQIRNSTDGMVNMAAQGNQFLFNGAEASMRGAAMKKEALMCVCDMIRGRFTDTQQMEINLGSSIMGAAYAGGQNALGQIQGLLNGIGSAVQGLIGPPPTLPVAPNFSGISYGANNAGINGANSNSASPSFF